ncbi:hypothetical protein [Azotobacter armeniacus]
MTAKTDFPSEQFALELPQVEDERAGDNLLAAHFRLKVPCIECPLRKSQQNMLPPDELERIISELMAHDFSTRQCQRVARFNQHAPSNKKVNYFSSGTEAMCAGAAAFLLKRNSPTLGMRVAISTEAIPPDHWDEAKPLVID